MKILHVITTIDVGGAEVQLLALATRQVETGNTVTVIPVKGKSELAPNFSSVGVEIILSMVDQNPIEQYLWLRKFVTENEFDIIHGHLPRAQILTVYASRDHKKVVLSRHDAMPFISKFPIWLSNVIWKTVKKRSRSTIVISGAICREMMGRGEIKKESEVNLIHYGIPTSFSASSLTQTDFWPTAISKVDEDLFIFGTVSRFVQEKNLQILLKAFALVRKQNVSSILMIVGYGPLESQLRLLAKELMIDEHVYFVGKQENVYDFLRKMDAFILPSTTEGFGLVLLEAMSANLPIIASEVDAIPEVLGENGGLLFQPDDLDELVRLMLLVTNPSINQSLRAASSDRVKVFSIEKSEQKIMMVYKGTEREGISHTDIVG